ncbi:hypothetical protein NDU88_002221, partial [Pleurodeles waltl]
QIITMLEENQRLQREYCQGVMQQWQAHNATMASMTGVLRDISTTLHASNAHQQAPFASNLTSASSTSATANGMEALTGEQQPSDTPTSVGGTPLANVVIHPDIRLEQIPRPKPLPGSEPHL